MLRGSARDEVMPVVDISGENGFGGLGFVHRPSWIVLVAGLQHVQKGDVGGLRMEVWPKKHLGRGAGQGRMNRYHLEISARREERQVRVQNGGRIDFGGLGM